MSDDVNNKSNDKSETLSDKFKAQRVYYKNKIGELSKNIKDINKIIDVQIELYSERQIILEYSHKLLELVWKINTELSVFKKDRINYYMNDSDIKYDRFDRKDLIDGDMNEKRYNVKMLENQVEYLKETIKTIDNMLWGIKTRISLEEYLRGV